MSSGLSLTDPALLAALERQRRLSVGDYHRMVSAGVFDEDERLELLEGVIVEMSPRSPRHALTRAAADDVRRMALPTPRATAA